MKIYLFLILLFSVSFISAQNGKLTITVTNIKEVKGTLHIGIYNKKENFPKEKLEYKRLVLPVKSNTLTHTITLPKGDYAISIYQDQNLDNECNKNWIGYPTEAFGFSNDVKPMLSAPSFSKCMFTVGSSSSISIKMF